MTLRAEIEIVPYGDESQIRKILRLDVSNLGEVENLGFGHVVCRYKVTLFDRRVMTDEWESVRSEIIERHDRREGAVALIVKAAILMEQYG